MTTFKTYSTEEKDGLPFVKLETLGTNQVRALFTVTGNVDLQGDRALDGFMDKSLERWKKRQAPIPVIFSHDWGAPMSFVGAANPEDITKTARGYEAIYTLDVEDNPVAAQLHRLIKRRIIREHSFAYDVIRERKASDGANELVEVDLIELGPTLKGANPATEVIAVKSAVELFAKAGRTLSTKNEADLRQAGDLMGQARDILDRVIASVTPSDDEQKAKSHGNITGSMEERRSQLSDAVEAWAVAEFPDFTEHGWAWIIGTFDDSVVVEVDMPAVPERHYRIPYALTADGIPELGTPETVEVDTVVVATLREDARLAAASGTAHKRTAAADDEGEAAGKASPEDVRRRLETATAGLGIG